MRTGGDKKIIMEREMKKTYIMQERINEVAEKIHIGQIHEFALFLPPWKRKRLY
jgi:hypothetical protein